MKYLLDTHAIIWYFENSTELSHTAVKLINSPENTIYICSVSLWEMVIKTSLGKLNLSFTLDEMLNDIKTRDFNIIQNKQNELLVTYLFINNCFRKNTIIKE